MEPIRVLIVDDYAMFREGLRMLLEREPDVRVVGEAADGVHAVEQTETLKPDVILLDIQMPDANGLDLIPKLRGKSPESKILVVTEFLDSEFITSALQGGARGYVMKTADPATLPRAVRAVWAGELWAERKVLTALLDGLLTKVQQPRRPTLEADEPLTVREREIVRSVIQGMTNKEIAAQLQISDKTVKAHLSNIFKKLNVNRRVELLLHQLVEPNVQ